MKKLRKFNNSIGKKNLLLSLVALILILMTVVSVSYAWIEEVSNVKLSTDENAQQTPLHISGHKLNSDVSIEQNGSAVDLSDFFNESGDTHLSACYSDGTNFMFPKSGTSTSDFRKGTKSDANTNYISMTFRVKSNDAPTAYWFEYKNNSNTPFTVAKDYTGETTAAGEKTTQNHDPTTAITQYLRASITANGATTVYGFNENGQFKYVEESNNTTTVKTATGSNDTPTPRPVSKYMYYDETYVDLTPVGNYKTNANKGTKYNQGGGDNLNGNTLFTIGADKTETITVKLWLEAGAPVTSVDATDLNLQITSSWMKTRRIYIRDKTVDEYDSGLSSGHTGDAWLTTDSNAKLYLAIYDNETPSAYTHYQFKKVLGTTDIYYADVDVNSSAIEDVPAVYAGANCAIYRCNSQWNGGNSHSGDISYWDKWETALPNTFHSEVFSIYSHKYGTWEEADAKTVSFVDSAKFVELGLSPKAYLWDSGTVYDSSDVNGKVVKNKEWPGAEMTRLYDTVGGTLNIPTFEIFYSSRYDRAVFNDGVGSSSDSKGLQTQDVWLMNGTTSYVKDYFDMATLAWYDSSELPNYTEDVLVNNFNQNGSNQAHIRMVWKSGMQETNNHYFMCRAYIKSPGPYFFKIYDKSENTHYGRAKDSNNNWFGELAPDYGCTLTNIGSDNSDAKLIYINITQAQIDQSGNGVFRFFYDTNNHYFIYKIGES
ncbi:MAG: hypothetical protein K6F88_04635 [Ruminococcus sp.]|nr:hypothetical protein [Ruminococcus sp.]